MTPRPARRSRCRRWRWCWAFPVRGCRTRPPASTSRRSCTARRRSCWHRPSAAAGTVVARHRVTRVVDKGPGRGATVTYDKALFDETSGEGTRDRHAHHLRARQRRLRDRGDAPGDATRRTGARARAARAPDHRTSRSDVAAAGAALPAVRRPQPVALRSRRGTRCRLRAADPARPVHLGHRGHAVLAQCVRACEPERGCRACSRASRHRYFRARRCAWRCMHRIDGARPVRVSRSGAVARDRTVLDHGHAQVHRVFTLQFNRRFSTIR
jgi:hypothetical protein